MREVLTNPTAVSSFCQRFIGFITAQNSSCGKVMSPQAFVIPSVHGWGGGGIGFPVCITGDLHPGGIYIKEKGGDLHQGEWGGLPTDDGRGSAYRGGGVMHSGGVLPTQEGVCIQRGSASRGGGGSTYRQKGVCLQVVCIQGVGVCLQGGLHP